MTEFLKGYAAGANDMEAGRLVTDTETIESLREQLAAANEILPEVEAQAERERVRAETYMYEREAAEAKLAEVEKELEELRKGDA